MEKQLKPLIHELETILRNLRKAPSRKYLKSTLTEKLKRARVLYEDITFWLSEYENSDYKVILCTVRRVFSEIKTFIDIRLDGGRHLKNFRSVVRTIIVCQYLYKKFKMTPPRVDLKTGTSIIPKYDGNSHELVGFIDAVKLFVDTVNQDFAAATADEKRAAKDTVLRFVKTRLSGKARSAIGDNPQNIEELLDKLETKCKSYISPESVVAKLNNAKQTGELLKFAEQIEKLTLDLERAYIDEHVPIDTASRMAVKAGVKALASGVRNPETTTLLKAGQFTTLASAVEKMIENEPASQGTNIFHVRQNNSRGNRYPGYSSNRFNNQTRDNGRNFRGRGQGRSFRGRNNMHQNYRPNYQNNYYRGGNRGQFHNNNSSRIYYASENSQLPQQNGRHEHEEGDHDIQNSGMPLGFQQPTPYRQQQGNQVALTRLMSHR